MIPILPIVSQQGGCDLTKQEVNSVNFLTEWGESPTEGCWQHPMFGFCILSQAGMSFLRAAVWSHFLPTMPCAGCDCVSLYSKVHIFEYHGYDRQRECFFEIIRPRFQSQREICKVTKIASSVNHRYFYRIFSFISDNLLMPWGCQIGTRAQQIIPFQQADQSKRCRRSSGLWR